eukprot:g3734.t1
MGAAIMGAKKHKAPQGITEKYAVNPPEVEGKKKRKLLSPDLTDSYRNHVSPFSWSRLKECRESFLETNVTFKARNQVNHYKVVQTIGLGASAKVLLVCDVNTGQQFAMKKLMLRSLNRHATKKLEVAKSKDDTTNPGNENTVVDWMEIAILKKIRHKNIIKLYEFINAEKQQGLIYLVMEYAKQGNLRNVLKHRKINCLPIDAELRSIICDILSGLYYLHCRGILHRDIKIENCLMGDDGVVKLCDFGISHVFKLHREREDDVTGIVGTIGYQAPEMYDKESTTYSGIKADIWSLGCVMYRLSFGKLPHDTVEKLVENEIEFPKKMLTSKEPNSVENFTELLAEILRKNPSHRASLDHICNSHWVNNEDRFVRQSLLSNVKRQNRDAKSELEYFKYQAREEGEIQRSRSRSLVYDTGMSDSSARKDSDFPNPDDVDVVNIEDVEKELGDLSFPSIPEKEIWHKFVGWNMDYGDQISSFLHLPILNYKLVKKLHNMDEKERRDSSVFFNSLYAMKSPFAGSNWVVEGVVMQGGYPLSDEGLSQREVLHDLISTCGCNVFVCLQQQKELRSLPNYRDLAKEEYRTKQKLLNEQKQRCSVRFMKKIMKELENEIKFYKLSIPDGCCAKDEQLEKLVIDLIADIQDGRILYVHCYGGHGRSGTLCALLLAALYNLEADIALDLIQMFHDVRRSRNLERKIRSPANDAQCNQVERIIRKRNPQIFRTYESVRGKGHSTDGFHDIANAKQLSAVGESVQ